MFVVSQTSLHSINLRNLLRSKITDYFGVSVTILLMGENSGQISIKFRSLACDVEPPPLINHEDLTMKSEFKYIFPTSFSGAKFYIYQLPDGLRMRRI